MLVVLLIGALVSGTRKSLICPILFLVFALFIKYKNKFGKLCISFLIASIFVFLGYKVMLSNQVFYERIGVRIENMITSITTKESDEGSINERALLRDLSLDLFKKKPIIGYGLHAFRYYSINNGGPYLYAHCNYTELLADLGIVGFSLYYFAYMYLVFLAIKEYKNKKFSLYIISFMLMNIIADYGTVSYYRHYYLIFYVMFATYLKIENNKVKIECEKK